MSLKEKTLAQKQIFQGNMISLRLDTVELPNGKESTREVVEHPGAVTILAYTEEKELLMVRQYRYPIAQETLELPAGKLDHQEDPARCAARELEEETGYKPGTVELLGTFYTSPGFSDEIMYLYRAENLEEGEQCCDEDEFVQVIKLFREEAVEKISKGEITDGKTITGILWPDQ
ncbi:NUDIX hydrolase [Metallumcola ferriviriculae]|uniref:NUDIX hydrolase n=1 Tax=Metallumcola ferriviriculae TaxID=3039180 RepID=A0AAU0URX2_9FIRM|nr:NUDIX hydrolase [Desulfitibacteraceae bacterium MK1]